jgi:hypothetical protein
MLKVAAFPYNTREMQISRKSVRPSWRMRCWSIPTSTAAASAAWQQPGASPLHKMAADYIASCAAAVRYSDSARLDRARSYRRTSSYPPSRPNQRSPRNPFCGPAATIVYTGGGLGAPAISMLRCGEIIGAKALTAAVSACYAIYQYMLHVLSYVAG